MAARDARKRKGMRTVERMKSGLAEAAWPFSDSSSLSGCADVYCARIAGYAQSAHPSRRLTG